MNVKPFAFLLLLGSLLLLPVASHAALFGTTEFKVSNTQSLPRWESLLSRYSKQRGSLTACASNYQACTTPALRDWYNMLTKARGQSVRAQLETVNRFANKWPYKTDWQAWGQSDYWATPLEFMDRSGDCEDYSFMKYVTLQALGYRTDQLRLVIVQDTIRNLAHAVLAVYLDNDIIIMDSLFDQPLSHMRVLQYSPYYSVNENARWAHVAPLSKKR